MQKAGIIACTLSLLILMLPTSAHCENDLVRKGLRTVNGSFEGEKVPVALIAGKGMEFSWAPLEVRGELREKKMLKIVGLKNEERKLIVSDDTALPFCNLKNSHGEVISIPFTHAANVVWEFDIPVTDLVFVSGSRTYTLSAKEKGATIEFGKGGLVRANGFNSIRSESKH
jgi:hypothetical protein